MSLTHYKLYRDYLNYGKIQDVVLGSDSIIKSKPVPFDDFIDNKYKKDNLNDKRLCKILLKSHKKSNSLILNIYNSKLEQKVRDIIKDYHSYNSNFKD